MHKVICFGEALVDLLSNQINGQNEEQETFSKFAGGAPANVSVAVAKLGGNAFFCGMLGKDMFGEFLFQALANEGVNTRWIRFTSDAKTGLAFVSLDENGERQFEFYRPPAADLLYRPEHFDDIPFGAPGIFHFCSNSLTHSDITETTLSGVSKAAQHDWLVSFDVNLRLNLWPQTHPLIDRVESLLAFTDVLKMSAEELLYLANGHAEEYITKCLDLGVKLIIVTDGGNPLRWHTKRAHGELRPPTIDMVDATAAGDAFVGGLLYQLSLATLTKPSCGEWFENSQNRTSMLQFASACGAYAASRQGAFPSIPDQQALSPLLREYLHEH